MTEAAVEAFATEVVKDMGHPIAHGKAFNVGAYADDGAPQIHVPPWVRAICAEFCTGAAP